MKRIDHVTAITMRSLWTGKVRVRVRVRVYLFLVSLSAKDESQGIRMDYVCNSAAALKQ